MTLLNCHVTTELKYHVTLWVRPPHPESAFYQVLGAMDLVNVEIQRFWFVTWPSHWCVTRLCGWSPLIPSHQRAKFGFHRSGENGDINFFLFVTWSWDRGDTWLCGWGPLILSHHCAKFGVHKPCRTENNGAYNISFNSNSNAEITMLRFLCRGLKMAILELVASKCERKKSKFEWIFNFSTCDSLLNWRIIKFRKINFCINVIM